MDPTPGERRAACLCGACTAATTPEPLLVTACACIDCQRRGRGAFGYSAFFPADSVATRGETQVHTHRFDSGRTETAHRCAVCGSPMWFTMEAMPGCIGLRASSFADPGFPPPAGFYFARSRHPWLMLPEGLPQRKTL
jgi:hypothetical protein